MVLGSKRAGDRVQRLTKRKGSEIGSGKGRKGDMIKDEGGMSEWGCWEEISRGRMGQ